MTKIVNRKTGLVFKVDCRNNTIEFEGNDNSFFNVLKGKL